MDKEVHHSTTANLLKIQPNLHYKFNYTGEVWKNNIIYLTNHKLNYFEALNLLQRNIEII